MISRIEAYDFRCFKQLDLALGQHHIFAGANGSGKTTLLDIPVLFGDLIRSHEINDAFFSKIGGRLTLRAESASDLIHRFEGDHFFSSLPLAPKFFIERRAPLRSSMDGNANSQHSREQNRLSKRWQFAGLADFVLTNRGFRKYG